MSAVTLKSRPGIPYCTASYSELHATMSRHGPVRIALSVPDCKPPCRSSGGHPRRARRRPPPGGQNGPGSADIQFIDTGLLASLAAISPEALMQDRGRFGAVLGTFVFGELLKHAAASVSSLWGQ